MMYTTSAETSAKMGACPLLWLRTTDRGQALDRYYKDTLRNVLNPVCQAILSHRQVHQSIW